MDSNVLGVQHCGGGLSIDQTKCGTASPAISHDHLTSSRFRQMSRMINKLTKSKHKSKQPHKATTNTQIGHSLYPVTSATDFPIGKNAFIG
jgi:hypothetical protein